LRSALAGFLCTGIALGGCGGGAGKVGVAGSSSGSHLDGYGGVGQGEGGGGEGEQGKEGRAGMSTARSGALTVELLVEPSSPKRHSPVRVEIEAHEREAHGALGYLLSYGDGTTSGSGAVPLFCLGGAGHPATRVWRRTHRYAAARRYVVSASVYVNCSRDRAVASIPVVVR
jgi:hypothetical protein